MKLFLSFVASVAHGNADNEQLPQFHPAAAEAAGMLQVVPRATPVTQLSEDKSSVCKKVWDICQSEIGGTFAAWTANVETMQNGFKTCCHARYSRSMCQSLTAVAFHVKKSSEVTSNVCNTLDDLAQAHLDHMKESSSFLQEGQQIEGTLSTNSDAALATRASTRSSNFHMGVMVEESTQGKGKARPKPQRD